MGPAARRKKAFGFYRSMADMHLTTAVSRLRGRMAEAGMGLSSNDRRIAALKNRHVGRRAFVLGNGPSLCAPDLDRLQDEITFAANKIYLAYDQTPWRPTYYFVSDRLVAEQNRHEIRNLEVPRFFPDILRATLGEIPDTIYYPTRYPSLGDLWEGVADGGTVLAPMMQFAWYMGIREIYLLGVDFSFNLSRETGQATKEGDQVLTSQGEVNHFHADYRKPGEAWTYPKLEYQRMFFADFRGFAKQTYGRDAVLNATRSTKLDIYPRVNLDAVLGRKS